MSDVLGSAAWSTDPGYWRYTPIGNAGSPMQGCFLLLGESHIRGNLHVRPPVQHMISIAPTRSGKGVSLIIPNLLTYRGSVLVVDPKGENAWVTAAYRRDVLGQKTVIVDPWGEVNRRYGSMAGVSETVARFNPLSILDPESDEYVDDLAYLADAIIISQSSRDPHWDDSARELVAGLIAFVVESPAYRAEASLALVRGLLSLPGPELRVVIQRRAGLGTGEHRENEARPLRWRHQRDQFGHLDGAHADGISRQRRSVAQHGGLGFQFRGFVPGEHLDLSGAAARQIGNLCAVAEAHGLDRASARLRAEDRRSRASDAVHAR